ncbi:unnamed protein product [Amoebophrya sp. A120]|nr:unnamed protein product [Amoebophrya sp. A120]|eukprot:GSA120T00006609001.1
MAAEDETPDFFPLLAFGTYKVGRSSDPNTTDKAEVLRVIRDAVQAGYRAFDCAEFYGNEVEVGEALWASWPKEDRGSLYVIGKVWTSTIYAGPDAVVKQMEQSLRDLQASYFDLFLIHWPVPEKKHIEAYKALMPFVGPAKPIRRLGLSNYTVADYTELVAELDGLEEAGKAVVRPYSNQFEVSPWLYRQKTIDFFQSEGLKLQAYRPFADGRLLSAEKMPLEIRKIAEKHKTKPSRVLLQWIQKKNIQALPKSCTKERIVENLLDVNDAKTMEFLLDKDDLEVLDSMHKSEEYEATFKKNYVKCIVRDTPLAGSITVDGITDWHDG